MVCGFDIATCALRTGYGRGRWLQQPAWARAAACRFPFMAADPDYVEDIVWVIQRTGIAAGAGLVEFCSCSGSDLSRGGRSCRTAAPERWGRPVRSPGRCFRANRSRRRTEAAQRRTDPRGRRRLIPVPGLATHELSNGIPGGEGPATALGRGPAFLVTHHPGPRQDRHESSNGSARPTGRSRLGRPDPRSTAPPARCGGRWAATSGPPCWSPSSIPSASASDCSSSLCPLRSR